MTSATSTGGSDPGSLPNILMVVMDCVRASDFLPASGAEMGVCTRLQSESMTFDRVATVSPWTVPSHASLFTGLYPWRHGAHMKRAAHLSSAVPTLATRLGSRGYRTASFSANGFICPEFGLSTGFDFAAWGAWWENYLRLPPRYPPPNVWDAVHHVQREGNQIGSALHTISRLSVKFPLSLNLANLWTQRVFGQASSRPPVYTPWIEGCLDEWVRSQPERTPVFCFVNYLDAHEPYVATWDGSQRFRDWWSHTRTAMDRASVLAGTRVPSAAQFDSLHDMYLEAIQRMDARIGALVESFRSTGRWENTLMILTSDHGQAFGEHGHIFHSQRLWEPIARVPLWYRPPGGHKGRRQARGWASLIDVVPTILRTGDEGLPPEERPLLLEDLVEAERPEPVFAISDGLQRAQVSELLMSAEKAREWDTPWVVGYEAHRKVTINLDTREVFAYDIDADPRELSNLWSGPDRAEFASLYQKVERIGERYLSAQGPTDSFDSQKVVERLRSWGYD